MSSANLRHLPAIEKLLIALGGHSHVPRAMIAAHVRAEVARMREAILAGAPAEPFDAVCERLRAQLDSLARSRLRPLINGTGVIVHTNLGRAPLGSNVADRLADLARGYCNLEFDLDSGERGHRGRFAEEALALLCEAGAATVVNNCAAALVIVLRVLTTPEKNEVIVSRGELVEIGGGFRIPEILQSSGARMREVGTTNRTSLADYERAIGPATAMILCVHRSNFYIEGFTAAPELPELVELARSRGLPIVADLGSGAMLPTDQLHGGLEHEPTPAETLRSGVDLVCISGDKLFGGPQAGIIAGTADWIACLKADPFFRALRCDKLILGALEATCAEYLSAAGNTPRIPVLEFLELDEESLRSRAEKIIATAGVRAVVGTGTSRCGGGTMPRSSVPSISIDVPCAGSDVEALAARLRTGDPPVVGYVSENVFKVDLRTVFPWQDELLARTLAAAATHVSSAARERT